LVHPIQFKMEAALKGKSTSTSAQAQKEGRSRAKEPNLGQKEAQIEQKSERELSRMGELTKEEQSGAGKKG
jgi:hypothetical protein